MMRLSLSNFLLFISLCLALSLGYAESENQPGLSAEAEQLLGRLKTGLGEYAANRSTGNLRLHPKIPLKETLKIRFCLSCLNLRLKNI